MIGRPDRGSTRRRPARPGGVRRGARPGRARVRQARAVAKFIRAIIPRELSQERPPAQPPTFGG